MSDYRNSYDNGHEDANSVSSADVNQAAANAFKHGAEAFSNAEIGQSRKFMGLVSMDAGIADMLDGIYNVGATFVSDSLKYKIFGTVEKHAPAIPGVAPKTLAAVASIGSTVVFKTAGYFGPIWNGISTQRNQIRDLTHAIAPVLDDIKGNHSVVALYTTSIKDNEIIYAHRARIGKIADNQHLKNITTLAVNSAGSLVLDVASFAHIWNHRQGMTAEKIQELAGKKPDHNAAAAAHDQQQTAWTALKTGGVGMLPQIAKRLASTSEFKLKKELQPYSALEMILELSDQVSSDPKARGFTVPRSFQSPNGRREQYPLEEYLMRICIQHQKDMSYLDPKHSEIREALREDLAASVKPLAEAIRKGDYNVMSLVRLVGEGKIIKKQGRAIASPAEIQAIIEKEEPKQAIYTPVDPTEYYKDATFSRAQVKSALKALEGDDKRQFASMFPDSILTEAGMSKDEVKSLRQAAAAKYDHMLASAVMGLNEKSDDVLKTEGLAHSEIEQIRSAANAIQEQGEAAMHDLKTSAINEHGIEHLLTNVTVHQPKYLGKLLIEGRDKLQEVAANDEPQDHAGRENNRRTSGSQHGQRAQ